jgi:hypothetical protein
VTAINDYGYSEESEPGNGANLQTNPDPPHSLIEVFEDRTASDVGLSWQPGFDGGTPVISYDIQFDQGTGNFVTVATENVDAHWVQSGLTIGTLYKFRVKANNAFGKSIEWSEELVLLCAAPPLAPSEPFTQAVASTIKISWSEPDNQGSPVTGYRIFIRGADQIYYEEDDHCFAFTANMV